MRRIVRPCRRVFISVRPDSEGFAFFSELVWNQFSAHRGGEVEVPLQFSQVSLMVRVRAASSPLSKPRVARRRPRHSVEYKMMVVRAALRRPSFLSSTIPPIPLTSTLASSRSDNARTPCACRTEGELKGGTSRRGAGGEQRHHPRLRVHAWMPRRPTGGAAGGCLTLDRPELLVGRSG